MKLIIQIPCYNEEKTLPLTVRDLPREIEGIDVIEIQVIDDGSTDRTLEVVKELGVHHIVYFKKNKGLAAAFKTGVDNALLNNADILINTDADNQYCAKDIKKLVEPILKGEADIVVGCRPIDSHPEFSCIKKKLQKLGSWVLRKVSKTTVKDAASGFRAYSKDALLRINIFSGFSYCMETLIQAGLSNMKIACVDIDVNKKTRESRLFKNIVHYIYRSGSTIVQIFFVYRATSFFAMLSLPVFLLSIILFFRYIWLTTFTNAPASSFWPTIIYSGVLLVISLLIFLTGVLTSLITSVRQITEEINYRVKKLEIETVERHNREG